jgi:hypothetical protein
MSLKNFITVTAALCAVASVYLYQYKDYFRRAHIQIAHTFRPMGLARVPQPGAPPPLNSVFFRLDRAYRLTSVRIVPIAALETNKFAHPIWELASASNSVPLQAFAYGMGIRGMQPINKGEKAEPLTTNVPYRLFVEAGKIEGEHDFTITEENHVVE